MHLGFSKRPAGTWASGEPPGDGKAGGACKPLNPATQRTFYRHSPRLNSQCRLDRGRISEATLTFCLHAIFKLRKSHNSMTEETYLERTNLLFDRAVQTSNCSRSASITHLIKPRPRAASGSLLMSALKSSQPLPSA
jgi:hypothetical protein